MEKIVTNASFFSVFKFFFFCIAQIIALAFQKLYKKPGDPIFVGCF